MSSKRFLIVAAGGLLFFVGLYLAGFFLQIGVFLDKTKGEGSTAVSVKRLYFYTDWLASEVVGRKIIIAAGSNGLFGIDSGILKNQTGLDVVNVSMHASLSLDFLYHKIDVLMHDGDVLVMPLEWQYYYREKKTGWEISNVMAWGWDDYLSRLSFVDLLHFISLVPKRRLLDGLFSRREPAPVLDASRTIREINDLLLAEGAAWRGYSHRSVNERGQILVAQGVLKHVRKAAEKGLDYLPDGKIPTEYFYRGFEKIKGLVERRGGRLIVVPPVTIRNKYFDLSNPRHQERVQQFIDMLATHGVFIRCNPALFQFDVSLFFNTEYHPNKYGAMVRTMNLGECLKSLIDDNKRLDIGYSEALEKVRAQEVSVQPLIRQMEDKQ